MEIVEQIKFNIKLHKIDMYPVSAEAMGREPRLNSTIFK